MCVCCPFLVLCVFLLRGSGFLFGVVLAAPSVPQGYLGGSFGVLLRAARGAQKCDRTVVIGCLCGLAEALWGALWGLALFCRSFVGRCFGGPLGAPRVSWGPLWGLLAHGQGRPEGATTVVIRCFLGLTGVIWGAEWGLARFRLFLLAHFLDKLEVGLRV